MALTTTIALSFPLLFLALYGYIVRNDKAMCSPHASIRVRVANAKLTRSSLMDLAEKLRREPISIGDSGQLQARTGRRYVVVGGVSGNSNVCNINMN